MAEVTPDGQATFVGGQDASKLPDRIPPQCYASAVNVSTSEGNLRPRWGVDRKTITFSDQLYTLPTLQTRPYKEIFESGKFQAVAPYTIGVESFLVIVVSGVIFLYNVETNSVSVLKLPDNDFLDETKPRINWTAAAQYLVFFDFPNYPVILDGLNVHRADPALYEVPISVMGAYNQNRLFISNNGGEFTAGDPTGNPLTPLAPVSFEEILAPSAPYIGQVFSLPTGLARSPITAMAFLQSTDTSTGIGPLLVSNARSIYSFQSQSPRNTWENGQFGSSFISDSGIVGPRAFSNVGSDLFYMSSDGYVRSASMSRDEQGRWSKAPVSFEVKNWLKFNLPDMMQYSVLKYFGNKIFVTANPYYTQAKTKNEFNTYDIAFAGMCVIELDNVSTMTSTSNPAWAGVWTGHSPMDLAEIGGRYFSISKDPLYKNAIYEINPKTTYDTADGNIRYVRSRIYTRSHTHESPFQNKDLLSLDLGITNMAGAVVIDTAYKPSHVPRFLPWRQFKFGVPWRDCNFPPGQLLEGFATQQFRELIQGTPASWQGCSTATTELNTPFRKVQLQITIEGKYWELNEYLIRAHVRADSSLQTVCDLPQAPATPKQCNNDWYVGDFEGCQATTVL